MRIVQMPALEMVMEAMENAPFEIIKTEKYSIHSDLEDKFLYCGKHNPTLYFDDQIRNGISSFSSLSNRNEVEEGLSAMRQDIKTGKINKVIQQYENQLGDYLYLIGKKPVDNRP